MYARIASFEGVGDVDQAIEAVKARVEENWESPPAGLEDAKEMWMLVDRENKKGIGITIYETEDQMQSGDQALSAMTPPNPDGQRTGVQFYEVVLRTQR
jgi:hypothetical protein